MAGVGLFVRMEAKAGKEHEVAEFLRQALPMVEAEPKTVAWYALQLGPSTFAIFDTFADDSGRQEHLSGKVAAALMAKAPDLFAAAPSIERADILAEKSGNRRRSIEVSAEERIPMQVGSELRITKDGSMVLDNPEIELAHSAEAVDTFLSYRLDPASGEHVIRVLAPLAVREGSRRSR